MSSTRTADRVALDRLDEQIVRALQLAPRAPFRRIADVLGVAEQTVARRYRALHRAGVLHVVAVVEPRALGQSDWLVRIASRPEGLLDLGRALARRPDVGWVSVSAGGSELVCAVRSHTQEERDRLLVDRLPRTASVLEVSAAVIMRRFAGGSASDWVGVEHALTPEQAEALSQRPPRRDPSGVAALDAADYALLDVLAQDGRAAVSALARAAGSTEGRVSRRLAALLESGTVYLDVDLAAAALGFPISAYVWLTVRPAHLDQAGRTLATYPQAPFVAAISGRDNLIASLTCRSLDELYLFVTERIGAVDGIQGMEVSPVLRRLKQAGSLVDGDRLAVTSRRAGR